MIDLQAAPVPLPVTLLSVMMIASCLILMVALFLFRSSKELFPIAMLCSLFTVTWFVFYTPSFGTVTVEQFQQAANATYKTQIVESNNKMDAPLTTSMTFTVKGEDGYNLSCNAVPNPESKVKGYGYSHFVGKMMCGDKEPAKK